MPETQDKAKQDRYEQRKSTVGVDVNEEMAETHHGFVKASDGPDVNRHVAGQTPASETNQPTVDQDRDELQRSLGEAERALSAHLVYEHGVASVDPNHVDEAVDALEDALKKLKNSKRS